MQLSSVVSTDTSVIVEYIDESGYFHPQATILVDSITSGRTIALIPHIVLAELYYVANRLYEKLDPARKSNDNGIRSSSPSQKAAKLLEWLYKSPNISVPENSLELALEAGRIKKEFALALTDSYVLAVAKLNKCKAVFKSLEDEMKKGDKLGKLEKGEKIELVFLENYN